jgi:phosphopantetheinyl transferase (holo-ACP synthase)
MFVGNDLEKLTIEGRSQHFLSTAFLLKCFTEKEMQFAESEPSLLFFYTKYWTQKEAAYKLFRQKGLIERLYNPTKLEITKIDDEQSICRFQTHQLFVKTMFIDDFVHSIAVEDVSDFEKVMQLEGKLILCKIGEFPFVFWNGFWRNVSKSCSHDQQLTVLVLDL